MIGFHGYPGGFVSTDQRRTSANAYYHDYMGGNNIRGGPRNDASPIHQADYGKIKLAI